MATEWGREDSGGANCDKTDVEMFVSRFIVLLLFIDLRTPRTVCNGFWIRVDDLVD